MPVTTPPTTIRARSTLKSLPIPDLQDPALGRLVSPDGSVSGFMPRVTKEDGEGSGRRLSAPKCLVSSSGRDRGSGLPDRLPADDPVASRLLGFVEGRVGALQEVGEPLVPFGERGDADAHGGPFARRRRVGGGEEPHLQDGLA